MHTRADWNRGDRVIVHPSVQGEKVKELFGDNVETVYVSEILPRFRVLHFSRFLGLSAIPLVCFFYPSTSVLLDLDRIS